MELLTARPLDDLKGAAYAPHHSHIRRTRALGLGDRLTERPASAQMMARAQVANLISEVENGVDELRNYVEKRGDNARATASTVQASGTRKPQGPAENQKAKANSTKDALNDALGDLNRSTRYGEIDCAPQLETAKKELIGMNLGDCWYS